MLSSLTANPRPEGDFRFSCATRVGPDKGEYQGAFAFVTVMGAEILDENFRRENPIVVRQARQTYLRLLDPTATASSQNLTVHAFDEGGVELAAGVPVTVNRVGSSAAFLAQLTLFPDGDSPPGGTIRSVPGGVSTLRIRQGTAQKGQNGAVVPYKFKIEFANPSNVAVSEQYTVVEGAARNYAEKTYLLVTVRNPHKGNQIVTNFNGCGFIQELAVPTQRPKLVFSGQLNPGPLNLLDNNVDHGGDLIYSPDAANPEGQPGMSFSIENGRSSGRDGEGAFFVRAVARYRQEPPPSNTVLSSFISKLQGATPCPTTRNLVDPSDLITLDMWVDQEDYFPRSQPPGRHPSRTGNNKQSIDWMEKQARDLFAAPGPSNDEQGAFEALDLVLTDAERTSDPEHHHVGVPFTIPYSGTIPDTQYIIHLMAKDPGGLRWGTESESEPGSPIRTDPVLYAAAGFTYSWNLADGKYFESVLSHEARHTLQWRIAADPAAGDTDRDTFALSTIWNGVARPSAMRLVDQRNTRLGGANTEFDFDPERSDHEWWKSSRERDALRVQRHNTSLTSVVLGFYPPTPRTIRRGQTTVTILGILEINPPYVGPTTDASGTIVVTSVTSGPCQLVARSGELKLSDIFSSRGSVLSVPINAPDYLSSCTVHLKLVRPASLTGGETELDYDVPIQIVDP